MRWTGRGRQTLPKRAAVFGCGPAGLFAAHGLKQLGYHVNIYSKRRKSELFGAQYLHAPIPGLTDGDDGIDVQYRLVGTPDGYRDKVYKGHPLVGPTSVQALESKHRAWDIRRAYGVAWNLYRDLIQEANVTPEFLGVYKWEPNKLPEPMNEFIDVRQFDRVISSIPLRSLCYQPEHIFESQEVWAIGDAPERGVFCPITVAESEVICDGTKDRGWYRASNVYGYRTAEWPVDSKPPLPNIARVEKPIGTNCVCYPGMERVGRYGRWLKGVLSHHAYLAAVNGR
jgi:hypothetical protein